MIDVPADTPLTTPVPEPTVATPVAPELHVPLLVASVNVTVAPAHTAAVPDMADGAVPTVTVTVALPPASV
jgi:hypothetical protein